MAEERHASDDELRQVLIGAIAAAPSLTGIQPGIWTAKVNECIPFVAAMMAEGSHQMRIARDVATAQIFVGIYRGHEVESSSTRCVVTFVGERDNSEPETIRTHRTDSSAGKAMQARLDKLAEGTRIVLYKAMEEMSSGQGRKVRILVHFETLPSRGNAGTPRPTDSGSSPIPDDGAATQPPPSGSIQGGGGDPDFGPAPATPPERGPSQADIDVDLAKRFNDLAPKVKVHVVRRFRESDIEFPAPQVDKIPAFIAIIEAEERNA